ncbi:hypothetical protein C0993_009415 [Termitomyces sp. T159_Od127]|nr:hypothetical protein C0993_009415 [Termitomyces sp. T159_Od127]
MAIPLVPILRTGVFAFVVFAAVIVLALCAHVTNTTVTLFQGYFVFTALGIATSLLAFLSLPVMLIVDNMRKGAVTSMIVVEISWLGLLWVLFLSTAATASQAAAFTFGNSCSSPNEIFVTTCREFMAIQAFAHLAWLVRTSSILSETACYFTALRLVFGYLVTLIVLSFIHANRGYHRVWYQSVKETDFNAPLVNVPSAAAQTQLYIPTQSPVPVQPVPVQQYPPAQNIGAYPPQTTPAPGWTGTPQQTLAPAPYHQA